jgi:hypothetical protein
MLNALWILNESDNRSDVRAALQAYREFYKSHGTLMARCLARACPRCNDYVGITIREPGRNVPVQAVNGRCSRCPYRIAWIVIPRQRAERPFSPLKTKASLNPVHK